MPMSDPKEICEELRQYLNDDEIVLADVERETGLSVSWLSKFRRGVIPSPSVDNLSVLYHFREGYG